MLMTTVHLFLARRDLKVPDLAGDYCMVVQFGSEGHVTLSSRPVRALLRLFLYGYLVFKLQILDFTVTRGHLS